jgi:hypothetical protein
VQGELPTRGGVAEALERVYARPELGPPPPGLLDPVREWIDRVLRAVGRLFSRVFDIQGDSPWLHWLVVTLLAVLGVVIIGFLLHQTLSRLGADSPRRGNAEASIARGARARSAPEWDALAARLAGEGRYREATLALYQALLLRMEAAGALRYDPAKTPGDYRREVRPHPQGPVLGAFLRGFEPVAFGGRTLEADGYDRLRAAAAGEA